MLPLHFRSTYLPVGSLKPFCPLEKILMAIAFVIGKTYDLLPLQDIVTNIHLKNDLANRAPRDRVRPSGRIGTLLAGVLPERAEQLRQRHA